MPRRFPIGAQSASFDEDGAEPRWTTSEERDAAYEHAVKALVKDQTLSDLTPEQVESAAFRAGFEAGIRWMEEGAPRA